MRYSYIRTPMNALLGYNQLMKKELTDPKLLHYQRAVEQSGNLLLKNRAVRKKNKISDLDKEHKKSFINQ